MNECTITSEVSTSLTGIFIYCSSYFQELDRIDLSRKSRRECNDLLLHWGFSLKRHQNLHPDENEAFKVEL